MTVATNFCPPLKCGRMTSAPDEVVTTYLEMTSRSQLEPRYSNDPRFRVCEIAEPDWQLNRWLYLNVGERWGWTDKRTWSDACWQEYASSSSLRTFVATYGDEIAGYYELHREGRDVEIAYLGLLPAFICSGVGGAILTISIEDAWLCIGSRVWVHTCSLDHPQALANYLARGMQVYSTSTRWLGA